MIRRAHRTVLARFIASLLVMLAASPVTAPFTTIELSDLDQSHPADTGHHPGHQMAEAQVKTAPHLVVTSPDMTPGLVTVRSDASTRAIRPALDLRSGHTLHTILRL